MQCLNGNIYKKAKTSSQRHLPVLVFEIEPILSQKPERAAKSSKKQRTTNGNTPQKPKRAITSTKKQQIALFIPMFIHLFQLWTYARWLTSRAMKNQKDQQRATKSRKKQLRATESKNGQRSWKNQNRQ